MKQALALGLLPQAEGVIENVASAFEQRTRSNHSAEQERIAYLDRKIQTKDEGLAELMA